MISTYGLPLLDTKGPAIDQWKGHKYGQWIILFIAEIYLLCFVFFLPWMIV